MTYLSYMSYMSLALPHLTFNNRIHKIVLQHRVSSAQAVLSVTPGPPASACQVLGLQACSTMPGDSAPHSTNEKPESSGNYHPDLCVYKVLEV